MSICSDCEKQLVKSNQFRRKCLLSNDYLLELRLRHENDNFDSDDDTPLDSLVSLKHLFNGLGHQMLHAGSFYIKFDILKHTLAYCIQY